MYKYSFSEYPWDCFFPKDYETLQATLRKTAFALSVKSWTIRPRSTPAQSLLFWREEEGLYQFVYQ